MSKNLLKEDILNILSNEIKGGLKSSTSEESQTFIGGLKSSSSEKPQTFIGGLKADPPKEIPYSKPKPLKHENSEIVGAYPIADNGLDAGGGKHRVRPEWYYRASAIRRHRTRNNPHDFYGNKEDKRRHDAYVNKGTLDFSRPGVIWEQHIDPEISFKSGLVSKAEMELPYSLPEKNFTKEQREKALKGMKMVQGSYTDRQGMEHFDEPIYVPKDAKTWAGKGLNWNGDTAKVAKEKKAKSKATAPARAKARAEASAKRRAEASAKAPAKAPAKEKAKAKRAPSAWQQFVKEFSKTYKGDNKDRLKEASKAYKAKGSPPVPPPYKDIVKAPPVNRSKKSLTITKTSSGEVIPVKRREKKSAEKKAPAPAKPKAKKAPKKLKKKLVLVEPEPDNRIKEAVDKYKLHLSRIEGYVEDGSFERNDRDYKDMYEEAEEELDKELKKLGSSFKKLFGNDDDDAPKKKAEPKKAEPAKPKAKKAKKSKKKKLVLVEPKANMKLVIKEKKQLPPCPPKKVRDPVTNRCKHKKKFTKPPSKYNAFVKQWFKDNKGTTLKLASVAWKAHKEGKVAEPSSPEPRPSTDGYDYDSPSPEPRPSTDGYDYDSPPPQPRSREPTPYLPDDSEDDTAITESGLKVEQPRIRKKKLKVVDELPFENENRELADILDSFDAMVRSYIEIYNSGEGGDNKMSQFRRIDEGARDYHLGVMAQQDKFSQESLNRIDGAYNHVIDESRRLKQTINNGVPEQQMTVDTYDYDSEDDHIIDALHVEPSTLDDSNFGVAFAPTEDNYEWDDEAVPPLKVGEVSMQNYPFERIYEAPPSFRDKYDVLYPPPAEYSDFRSDVFPKTEKRDLKADIEERVFAKYMEIMKRFNPNTSHNHIKEMWAKNRANIYDLLLDEITDKKGGNIVGDILKYDPSLFVNALEKIGSLAGGMCEDECDGGAYGGELIGRGGALSKMKPKKLINKIIFELVTKVAKEKGYQSMAEITSLYKKHKKRIDDNMFELMEDRLMKESGGSYMQLPSGVDASKFYKSGDRFYEKRERPKVFDRAIYDAKNNVTRTNATRTADTRFIPRIKGANREPVKAPMKTDEEKAKQTTAFGNRDLPYQDTDMTDLGDPKAWANTAYSIGAGAYDAVKEILTWLPSFSINVI
jgi:hypothetical protein